MIDVSHTLEPKTDQLNADDLRGGPIDVEIMGVRVLEKGKQQPLIIQIRGRKPWKPCKTMGRLLAKLTGTKDGAQWVGRRVRLYRDPNVNSPEGERGVGGIRLSHMSGILGIQRISLTESKGRNKIWIVHPLLGEGEPPPNLEALLEGVGLAPESVDTWRASLDPPKPPVATLTDQQRQQLADWLSADPSRLEAVRAVAAPEGSEE